MNTIKDFNNLGTSPYLDDKESPRRYFLISRQLPFFIEDTLKNTQKLDLSKEDITKVKELMTKTKPQVVDNATNVKRLELEAIEKIVDQKCSIEEVDKVFEQIANIQLKMQRIHANCIKDVQSILSDDQYDRLIQILKNEGK